MVICCLLKASSVVQEVPPPLPPRIYALLLGFTEAEPAG